MSADSYQKDSVRIESFAIEEEFIRLPSDLAYWGEQYAQAFEDWQNAEISRKERYSSLYLAVQDMHPGPKRPTENETKATVECNADYLAARRHEASTEARKVRLYGIVAAVQAKKEMLISLGAHMRAERAGDPMIRTKTAVEREVERTKNGF